MSFGNSPRLYHLLYNFTMETNNESMQNIKEEAMAIFKTILLTKQVYAMNYLVRIVRGDMRFELKKPEHAQLETFGCMANVNDYRLKNIVTWLLKNYYLNMVNLQYGSLGLTAKAFLVMHSEEDLLVGKKDLQINAENRVLSDSLKKIRKAIAETEDRPIFSIFTDWSLQNMIDSKPQDIATLKTMGVMNEAYTNTYGHLLIKAIKGAKEESIRQLQEDLQRRVKTPTYQAVKSLFLAGCAIENIAETRQIKQDTVLSYLGDLHRTGEIDMKPWIAERVDAKILQKVADFLAQEQVTFRDAYRELGLDYQTLVLSKLYATKI